jgi:hypothetical protein
MAHAAEQRVRLSSTNQRIWTHKFDQYFVREESQLVGISAGVGGGSC